MELEEYLVINIHGDNMAKFECNPPQFFFGWLFLWLSSKESTCYCGGCKFDPWVGKIP